MTVLLLVLTLIFADGFEQGSTTAWSAVVVPVEDVTSTCPTGWSYRLQSGPGNSLVVGWSGECLKSSLVVNIVSKETEDSPEVVETFLIALNPQTAQIYPVAPKPTWVRVEFPQYRQTMPPPPRSISTQ